MSNLNINVDKKNMTTMWDDIIKFLTVAIVIHLLLCITDDYDAVFDEKALKVFLYITLGVITYHLVVKKFTDKCLTKQTAENYTVVNKNNHTKKYKNRRKNRKN